MWGAHFLLIHQNTITKKYASWIIVGAQETLQYMFIYMNISFLNWK